MLNRSEMTLRGWIGVLLCAASSNACTLIGLGTGAAIDAIPGPYDTRPANAHVSFAPKQRVMVWLANGERVEGRYLGAFGPNPRDPETYLIVDAGGTPKVLATSNIRALGVEQPGKGWLYGGVIGLAVDVTLVVMATIALSNMDMRGLKLGGDSGCFC